MPKRDFAYLVIGKGLMGSAATRYLTELSDRVAVIGPNEPADPATHDGVFASHYDEGRLTARSGKSLLWSRLARHAMAKYRWLEEASGIDFYSPVGLLYVGRSDPLPPSGQGRLQIALDEDVPHAYFPVGNRLWQQRVPHLRFPNDCWVLHELDPAGYINPRRMLAAELAVAERKGATVVRETVVDVTEEPAAVVVTTDAGHRYRAERLLVAAGAFSNFHNLLPQPIPIRLKTETIILAEVSASTATRLATLPVVNYQIDDPEIEDIYMVPPLRYPDGRYYLKLGCNTVADHRPTTLAEVQAWFRTGDSDVCKAAMTRALLAQLPDVKFLSVTSGRCIITYTPSGLPTIDAVSERIFVATGGNGSSAKCADTLGRLAAGFMHDERWLPDIARPPFELRPWPSEKHPSEDV